MAKFLTLWEMDMTQMPVDPKERIKCEAMLANMVKEDLKKGFTLDWGMFAGGELGGYAICEGTEQQITLENLKYSPFIKYIKISPILSISQVEEIIEKSQG